MLLAVTAVKLLAEIALLALLGQGLVGLMAGAGRNANPVYRLFQVLGRPWLRLARWMSPAVVIDRHVPLVACLVLALAWGFAAFAKVSMCLRIGVALCR